MNDGWRVRPKPEMVEELIGAGAEWMPVRLPHDAMIGQPRTPDGEPGLGYFTGGMWQYERELQVPEQDRGKRILVEFEGVYRSAIVYVNGVVAGHRPYGYSQFTVRLDQLLQFGGTNRIRVEATARADSRWYSGAGIYRSAYLVTGGPVHVAMDGVRILAPLVDERATTVEVSTAVESDAMAPVSTRLSTELVDPGGEVVARDEIPVTTRAGGSVTVRQMMVVSGPSLWNVDSPHRYTCRTRLLADGDELDTATTTFGIRSIEVDSARGLRINGAEVALRGACIHHDNGVIGAATIPRAEERRVELLKAAGFNALRSAHHPMSPAMLDACDRLGMLVMDEAFDAWTSGKVADDYARSFPEWWRRDLDAMVTKDFNHPSVVLYSIGNEIPDVGNPAGAAQSRAMADAIRALDRTRPVTNGINPLLAVGLDALRASVMPDDTDGLAAATEEMDINAMMKLFEEHLPLLLQQEVVNEKLEESCSALDVVGYNYSDSRYALDHRLHPNRVIVGSETNPPKIDELWKLVKDHAHVIGDFTWTGWDYLGEAGIGRVELEAPAEGALLWGPYPYVTAGCGDIDITGFRRPISYLREIVFGLRSDPYICVQPPEWYGREPAISGPWSSQGVASWGWTGHEGRPVRITVYADADEVALVLNGTEVGRAPAGEGHRFRAQFDLKYEPGELAAVAYRAGREAGWFSLHTAIGPEVLQLVPDRRTIRADDTDAAFIAIVLADDSGNVHHGADRPVTISVEGPGELLGFGSGNPRSEESFVDAVHVTFEGRALAVVRPTAAGTIMVSATADGCQASTVSVEVL